MKEVGLEEVEEYIIQRQNTVAQYILMRQIIKLCEEAERHPGTRVSKRRWDQEVLDLEGVRETATTAWEMGEAEGEVEVIAEK